MKIDTLTQKKIESSITHHVDVSVTLATIPVEEVSSSKYAEITGIAHKKIKQWCINGSLTCRRLDNDGNEVVDWKLQPKMGHWYIDTSKRIGEF
jgi:hypothetical protein